MMLMNYFLKTDNHVNGMHKGQSTMNNRYADANSVNEAQIPRIQQRWLELQNPHASLL